MPALSRTACADDVTPCPILANTASSRNMDTVTPRNMDAASSRNMDTASFRNMDAASFRNMVGRPR